MQSSSSLNIVHTSLFLDFSPLTYNFLSDYFLSAFSSSIVIWTRCCLNSSSSLDIVYISFSLSLPRLTISCPSPFSQFPVLSPLFYLHSPLHVVTTLVQYQTYGVFLCTVSSCCEQCWIPSASVMSSTVSALGRNSSCLACLWTSFHLYIHIPWPFPPVCGVADNTKKKKKNNGGFTLFF